VLGRDPPAGTVAAKNQRQNAALGSCRGGSCRPGPRCTSGQVNDEYDPAHPRSVLVAPARACAWVDAMSRVYHVILAPPRCPRTRAWA
jgi:hypothetical protein